MSVATELVPEFTIPEPARPYRLASVTVLHPPPDVAPADWRLTRRGVAVVAALVLVVGLVLVWVAKLSAPEPAAAPAGARTVTVVPGDTLWAIASRVAPDVDPRAEVAALQRRNHLTGVDLVPGQVLRVP